MDLGTLADVATTMQDDVDTWTMRSGPNETGVKISSFTDLGVGRIGEPLPVDDGHLPLAS